MQCARERGACFGLIHNPNPRQLDPRPLDARLGGFLGLIFASRVRFPSLFGWHKRFDEKLL
jgi:hypothetical protein